jgi:hypothetical protein
MRAAQVTRVDFLRPNLVIARFMRAIQFPLRQQEKWITRTSRVMTIFTGSVQRHLGGPHSRAMTFDGLAN